MANTAFVDLSSGAINIIETAQEDLQKYLGGRGLGAQWLFKLAGPQVEPLSPENVLIFTAGILVGTPFPSSSRLHITFKSPLTDAYGYANSGGFFAAELKHAGFDALIIKGRSPQPAYLEIIDEQITIKDGRELWGKTVSQTNTALLGEALSPLAGRVACIGPAGEKLVRISAIINEGSRAAARSGPGAVMGSKNLKAVHVKSTRKAELPLGFREEAKGTVKRMNDNPLLDGLRKFGTLVLMDPKNASGDQPAKNHQLVQVPFIRNINAAAFDRYGVKHKACYACPIKCSRQSTVENGPFAVELEGPEYETSNALGSMCWVSNPEAIIYANHLCNEYGLDSISTGVTVAFAMELHQRGLLDDAELSLEWGDTDSLIGLIEAITARRGIGDILAEGTKRAAERIGQGAEYYAMQIKGVEMPRQDPRFAKSFGLGHATSNRGADHLYALPTIDVAQNWDAARKFFPDEILGELMDPANEKYKPDLVVFSEHFCAVTDALGLCKFSTAEEYALGPDDLAPIVSLQLGKPTTSRDLLEIGERIINLERLYNTRQGMSRKDDTLPLRFTTEAAPLYEFDVDPVTGVTVQSPEPLRYGIVQNLEAMLDRYYDLRGWTDEGVPSAETLARLGLNEV